MDKMTIEESKQTIFGFCEIITGRDRIHKDRVKIEGGENLPSYDRLTAGVLYGVNCGIGLLQLNNFEFPPTLRDTDSHQIRVKAVYKNKIGYYIKVPTILYLNDYVVCSMLSVFEIEK